MNKRIRKTKMKLALFEQAGFIEALCDIIEMSDRDEGEESWTPEGREWLVQRLKKEYQKIIKENEKKNGRQQSLFAED